MMQSHISESLDGLDKGLIEKYKLELLNLEALNSYPSAIHKQSANDGHRCRRKPLRLARNNTKAKLEAILFVPKTKVRGQ
jgi:hypothetical protein